MYLGDFKEDGDIFHKFSTRAFATGIPTSLLGTPVLSVYKDEGGAATEKTTAESYFDLDVDHDSIAGWHNVRIDLSGDAFFATGADYAVVITVGTVDGVNVFGENLFTFSIENRSMGKPAGATLAADIAAIKALIPSALVGGRMDSDIGAKTGNVALSAQEKLDVNTEVDTALATTTYAEPSSVPAATSSLKDKIAWLFTLSRNKGTQTSTTKTLRNDADGADIATAAISDDGTTFTRNEWS